MDNDDAPRTPKKGEDSEVDPDSINTPATVDTTVDTPATNATIETLLEDASPRERQRIETLHKKRENKALFKAVDANRVILNQIGQVVTNARILEELNHVEYQMYKNGKWRDNLYDKYGNNVNDRNHNYTRGIFDSSAFDSSELFSNDTFYEDNNTSNMPNKRTRSDSSGVTIDSGLTSKEDIQESPPRKKGGKTKKKNSKKKSNKKSKRTKKRN